MTGSSHGTSKWSIARRNWDLYLLVLVPVAALIIYSYIPMGGIILAFKDYKVFTGIWGSKWVGLKHFETMFTYPKFGQVFANTLIINLYKFLFQFPVPIILALMLNEVRIRAIKRGVQTLVYLPHFLSWVVVAGLFFDILSLNGLLNKLIIMVGGKPIMFLSNARFFRSLLVASTMWKESGWSTIVYLSAITAIDPMLYEAASVDGAGRWRQTWSITLPNILSTIMFIVILRASSILGSDVEQVMMFYTEQVYDVGDVLGTYVYREGILGQKFSYTTAVGLFGSIIGMTMMLVANKISCKYAGIGIW